MRRATLALATSVALLTMACSGGSGSSNGVVHITIAAAWIDQELAAGKAMLAEWNRQHPGIQVTFQFYGNADNALQKVVTEIAGGSYPDIVYLYGSWAANIAKAPALVPLNDLISKDPQFQWNDFWPSERQAATVDGKIVGIPALVDNLSLVYNKKLFDAAGLGYPTPSWTWQDFRQAAKTLTNPAIKQFGWAYPADASEDTVWRYEAALWQAGGDLLTPDMKHAAFDTPAGVNALTFVQEMTAVDHSTYLDNGNGTYLGLFESGKIGMLWTGPWDLPDIQVHHVDYGVQVLPGDLNHQTISGPDNWVLLNNGSARTQAAWEFMKWFTAPAQDLRWSLATGELPIRRSVTTLPDYARFLSTYPGIGTFAHNLDNAVKARPTLASYYKISESIGRAIQAVMLGKAQPADALAQAAKAVDAILAVPS